jgi:hypothetical protein
MRPGQEQPKKNEEYQMDTKKTIALKTQLANITRDTIIKTLNTIF